MSFIVHTEDRKISIKDLFNSVQDGDIILDPEYQRSYVYDIKRASKIIESILLEIPLPAIFANEEKNSTMEIIDGVQRITSIINFLNSEYFLTGLEILSEFNGKTFKDLDSDNQRNLKNKSLHLIMFKKDCSDDLKFEIFLRLNQGSVKLNNQELRNCMYRGILNNRIKELAKDDLINELFIKYCKQNRFAKEELILRGLTILNTDKFVTKNGLNSNMNSFMNTFKNDEENINKFIKEYIEILNRLKTILSKDCFNSSFNSEEKFMTTYYDSLLLLFKEYNINSLIFNKDKIKERFKKVVKTEEFMLTIARSSTAKKNVNLRTNLFKNSIDNLILELDEKRNFSYKDKVKLFNKSNVCAICNNTIESIEDVNIDHIIPWSKGGKTILENAQITHEFCNKSKGNKEI